jgi:phospholipid-binding lipoprotein MlaA
MAVSAPEKPISERRARRSFQTPAKGTSTGVPETKTAEAASGAMEDDQYLNSDDEFADIHDGEDQAVADPIEGFNRVMFKFNDKLYFWFFRPVALGYSRVVPEPGRVAVRRFFDNVFMPVRFANNLFQLKLKNAGIELERFAINTTIGVAGFMDPAKKYWNLEMHEEDFGQTLGFYGVGPGVYINLPVYGPSNVRDTIGMVADIFLSPMAYILPNDRGIVVGISAFDKLNRVSLDIGLYEDIKRDALDPYIFIRNAYQQHRESLIKE